MSRTIAAGKVRMSLRLLLLSVCLALLILPTKGRTAPKPAGTQQVDQKAPSSCPVTIGRKSPISSAEFFGSGSAHWNGNLYVSGLWPDGTIVFRPDGPGSVYPDGSVGMKIAWYRGNGLRGKLAIEGKRLDAPAPPLRANFSDYRDTGFQPSEVIFPTKGCWRVTGRVADARVTFVTRVVKLAGLKSKHTQLTKSGDYTLRIRPLSSFRPHAPEIYWAHCLGACHPCFLRMPNGISFAA